MTYKVDSLLAYAELRPFFYHITAQIEGVLHLADSPVESIEYFRIFFVSMKDERGLRHLKMLYCHQLAVLLYGYLVGKEVDVVEYERIP